MTLEAKELINSVGIEMEFMTINRDSRKFRTDFKETLMDYKLDHDASCETLAPTLANFPIKFTNTKAEKKLSPFLNTIIIGGEIISPIRNTLSPLWMTEIHQLCDLLKEYGEQETTIKDSFHVHVNLSREVPLFVIKNILSFTLAYEAFLYKLGGMGRINRGVENSFIFERPYLFNGPPVIRVGNTNYPIFKTENLFKAESKEQFFIYYGDSGRLVENGNKYVVQRYMNVNFFPILTQGSIEFRTANKTLNPQYIIAWTNFCKAIVATSFKSDTPSQHRFRALAENKDIPFDTFFDETRILQLDDDTLNVLQEIWQLSPTPQFDNIWRYTHLRKPPIPRNISEISEALGKEIVVEKSNHEDIHDQEEERGGRHPRLIQVEQRENPAFPGLALPNRIRDVNFGEQINQEFQRVALRQGMDPQDFTHRNNIPFEQIPIMSPFVNFSQPDIFVKITKLQDNRIIVMYAIQGFISELIFNPPEMLENEILNPEMNRLRIRRLYEFIRETERLNGNIE